MSIPHEETYWEVWRAWYPVRLDDGRWAWGRDVEWSRQWEGSWGTDKLVNHYREIGYVL